MKPSIRTLRALRSGALALGLVAAAAPVAARAQLAVLTNVVEEHVASPGERYSGTIVISNSSAQQISARLYQTDYGFAADGTSTFGDAGTSARSNARWITPQSTRVVIPAHGQISVSYSVAVPAGDSLRGTYWSTIMVEQVTDEPTAQSHAAKPSVQLGAVMRYAIQVATHIQGSATRTVRFADANVAKTPAGEVTLSVDVHDAGERGYRPVIWVEVYDSVGTVKAKIQQTRGLLYPGTSLRQRFALGALPAGKYKAVVFADTGDQAVFATQFTLVL